MALTKVDDRGLKTPIDLQDNEKIRLGTGNDLELYHDGNTYIDNTNDSCDLRIQSDTIELKASSADEMLLKGVKDGAVELYHNNSKKIETYANGVIVTGTLSADQVGLGDSEKIILGIGDDLQIYHDGTNTYLDNNTGQFNIDAASGNAIRFLVDGSYQCQIYTSGIDLPDNKKLRLGDSEDLQIYHDSSTPQNLINSYTSTPLTIMSNGNTSIKSNNGDNMGVFKKDGAVELYHDNSKKFETTSSGVKISDSILEIADATCLIDLMETSTTNHRLRNGSGNFLIQRISDDKSTETTQFDIDGGTGAVSLYHEGTKKLSTTANGICFNSDTAAANALDDYEEGSFSPIITGIGGGTNPSFSAQSAMGGYIRVGKIVHCNLYIYDINCTSAGSNIATISGFPFGSGSRYYPGVVTHNTIIGSGNVVGGYLQASNNSPHFIPIADNSTSGATANTGNPKYIMVSLTYEAA